MLKQKLSRLRQADKGSVLVFTLLITGLMLATAMSLITVSSIERKTSGSSSKSTQSFQVADSGSEIVLRKIYKGDHTYISELGNCDADNNVVSGDIASGKDYKITFYNDAGVQLACTDLVSDVRKIKSVGAYARTSRAVEVAVAASDCSGTQTTFVIAESSDEVFTPSNAAEIKKFLRGLNDLNPGVIAGAMCWQDDEPIVQLSGGIVRSEKNAWGGNFRYSSSNEDEVYVFCTAGSLGSSGQCEGKAMAPVKYPVFNWPNPIPCNGGWAVIGFCN